MPRILKKAISPAASCGFRICHDRQAKRAAGIYTPYRRRFDADYPAQSARKIGYANESGLDEKPAERVF